MTTYIIIILANVNTTVGKWNIVGPMPIDFKVASMIVVKYINRLTDYKNRIHTHIIHVFLHHKNSDIF